MAKAGSQHQAVYTRNCCPPSPIPPRYQLLYEKPAHTYNFDTYDFWLL